MLLLIDAGNTRIKWATVNAVQARPAGLAQWAQTGSLSHEEFMNAKAGGAEPWCKLPVQRVVVSNVAGKQIQDALARSFQDKNYMVDWFASKAELGGITNLYRDSTQLGCDRFASAIAAHALFPDQALIIATCGTATTIDAVTAEGHFIGGMITPGLKLMAQSLAQNTAQLPKVADYTSATAHFANHTEAAIVSGCLAAQAGAIEHAAQEWVTQLNTPSDNLLCIVSGGAAQYIMPSLRVRHQFVDNLVLIGLQVVSS